MISSRGHKIDRKILSSYRSKSDSQRIGSVGRIYLIPAWMNIFVCLIDGVIQLASLIQTLDQKWKFWKGNWWFCERKTTKYRFSIFKFSLKKVWSLDTTFFFQNGNTALLFSVALPTKYTSIYETEEEGRGVRKHTSSRTKSGVGDRGQESLQFAVAVVFALALGCYYVVKQLRKFVY